MAARRYLRSGRVDSDIGSTHRHLSVEQSVAYIDTVYRGYLEYGCVAASALRGRRVLEVGPGDNLGVAALLYAAGADQVVCVDKFFSRRDEVKEAAIYRALRSRLTGDARSRFDRALALRDNKFTIDPQCIDYVTGVVAEQADNRFGRSAFDVIVSRAVLWEIFEIDRALAALDRLLRHGGVMIHKIACVDWVFRQNGYHPLEFLTIPDRLYEWLAADSGKSNRRTIDYYRAEMRRLGYDAVFHITQVMGRDGPEFPPGVDRLELGVHYKSDDLRSLHRIRSRLLPRFQRLSDDDLLVEDMFLVATKTQRVQGAGNQATG
jgi:SAM-dependent methyltransferase